MILCQKFVNLQEDYYALKEQCNQHELTLEELGSQLRVSKLQVADLQEEVENARRAGVSDATWMRDKEVTHCKGCEKEFNMTRRKVLFTTLCSTPDCSYSIIILN